MDKICFLLKSSTHYSRIQEPVTNPYERLTEYELLIKLEEAHENARNGMYKDVDKIFRDMRAIYFGRRIAFPARVSACV